MLMTRRSILAAGALIATPGLARAQTGAFKGKTLTVASWQNYGADDPATLKMFTDMTGATVKNVFFTSEDGLLQMLRQGGVGQIDACLPNLQYVLPGAQRSVEQPEALWTRQPPQETHAGLRFLPSGHPSAYPFRDQAPLNGRLASHPANIAIPTAVAP